MNTIFIKIKRKVIKFLKEAYLDIGYNFFGKIPASILEQKGLRILIYHGICKKDPHKFNSRFLSEELFEQHLKLIKKCFNVISFEDYSKGKFATDKLNVMLTFDDGLKNNYMYAMPLLLKYNIPAVFFITNVENKSDYLFNDLIDVFSLLGPEQIVINKISFVKRKTGIHHRYRTQDSILLASYFHACNEEERENILAQIFKYVPKKEFAPHKDYLELMDAKEIKEVSFLQGHYVASHGTTHCDFSSLSPTELNIELKESKEQLEHITGKTCKAIAFPYGSYNEKTLELCKINNYEYLFGTEKLLKAEDRESVIERFTVNPFVSGINQMYYIACNNYE